MMAVCLALSAYFSATETAFSSANTTRLRAMAEKGSRNAALACRLLEKYDRLLSTILIGNNIVNIATASIGTVLFVRHYGEAGATISTVVVTVVVLIFGEISPKSIAKDCAEKCATLSAPILQVLIWVLTPLNALFALWKKLLSRVFRLNGDSKMSQEELLLLVDEVQQEGSIDRDEGELLKNAIGFSEQTAEDILMHLLDGGFSSAAHFQLQASGTYLADFHPLTFALIDLEAYHNAYMGKRHLREELETQIPDAHPFLYKGDIFLFLHREGDADTLSTLAKEFQLKILVSEPLDELFDLPGLYRTAREALELMTDERFHGEPVCSVAQLRTPLLLKNLEGRGDLIPIALHRLAARDREKDTQYCETLYHYLTCCHSLKKTSDALYTHRNTVLYRIRRLQEDFAIPLEEPSQHADLLLGVSLILFEIKGPDFFLRAPKNEA